MSSPALDSNKVQPHIASAAVPVPASGWISLGLLTIAYAVYTIDKYVLSIVIEPLRWEFALSDSQLGLLTGLAANVPFLVTCIPLAMLADRVNRKWLLVALVVLWSLATGLGGFATTVTFLVAARVVVGALEAGFTPLAISILGDRFPPKRRPTAIGIFNVGATLGVFIALTAGGILVAAHGWRWAFFIAGMPGVIMGVLLALVERDPPRGAFDPISANGVSASHARLADAGRAVWCNSIVRYGAAGLVLCSAMPAVASTWIPSMLIRVHHQSIADAGFGAAVVGLSTALGAGCGGTFADWLGRHAEWRKLLAPVIGCTLASVFGLIGLLAAPNGMVAVAMLSAMGFINSSYAGVGYAAVLGNSPPWVRSTVLAIILMAVNVISGGLGNTLVGIVSDRTSAVFGQASILYGMSSILLFNMLGVLAFLQVMREIRHAGARQGERA